jgi:hypothetical protein
LSIDVLVLCIAFITALIALLVAIMVFVRWRRNRFRFSMRALLALFAIAGYVLFVILQVIVPAAEHRWAVRQIGIAGGDLVYRPDWDKRGAEALHTVAASSDQHASTIAQQLDRLPEVRSVGLHGSVTDAGVAAICRVDQPVSLETLHLDSWNITNAGLAHLANLKQLQSLSCACPNIDDAGLAHLQSVRGLQSLWLEDFGFKRTKRFSEKGLAEIGQLEGLTNLVLTRLDISDHAARHLHNLTQLKSLQLNECHVPAEAVEDLRAALPGCDVRAPQIYFRAK